MVPQLPGPSCGGDRILVERRWGVSLAPAAPCHRLSLPAVSVRPQAYIGSSSSFARHTKSQKATRLASQHVGLITPFPLRSPARTSSVEAHPAARKNPWPVTYESQRRTEPIGHIALCPRYTCTGIVLSASQPDVHWRRPSIPIPQITHQGLAINISNDGESKQDKPRLDQRLRQASINHSSSDPSIIPPSNCRPPCSRFLTLLTCLPQAGNSGSSQIFRQKQPTDLAKASPAPTSIPPPTPPPSCGRRRRRRRACRGRW